MFLRMGVASSFKKHLWALFFFTLYELEQALEQADSHHIKAFHISHTGKYMLQHS